MGRMAQLSATRLVRALVRLGWTLDRQSGSHAVLTKPGRNPVTVPIHQGLALKEATTRAIEQSSSKAGVGERALFEVY